MFGFYKTSELLQTNQDYIIFSTRGARDRQRTHRRVWAIARAFELGYTVQKIHELTSIDHIWLHKLATIQRMTEYLGYLPSIDKIDQNTMRELKVYPPTLIELQLVLRLGKSII